MSIFFSNSVEPYTTQICLKAYDKQWKSNHCWQKQSYIKCTGSTWHDGKGHFWLLKMEEAKFRNYKFNWPKPAWLSTPKYLKKIQKIKFQHHVLVHMVIFQVHLFNDTSATFHSGIHNIEYVLIIVIKDSLMPMVEYHFNI